MGRLQVKRWSDFQHYSTRRPPWIKLHRSLLDDTVFVRLPLAARALAPLLWLLASESDDGTVESDSNELSFRLRIPQREIQTGLEALIASGYLVADGVLASCEPDARLEEKRREETETEKKRAIARPSDVSDQVWQDWLALRRKARAPVTETALAGLRREAGKAGLGLEAVLTVCVTNGWRGFQADWLAKRNGKAGAAAGGHIQNMPLGTPSCGCSECVAFRAKREGAA